MNFDVVIREFELLLFMNFKIRSRHDSKRISKLTTQGLIHLQ